LAIAAAFLVCVLSAAACQNRRPLTPRGYWTSDVEVDLSAEQSELCKSLIDYRAAVLTLATTDLRNLSVNEFKTQRAVIADNRGEVQRAARNVKDNGVEQVSTAMSDLSTALANVNTGSVVELVRSAVAIKREIDGAVTAVDQVLAQRGCPRAAPSA
jgi:hypothetical protein